VSIVQGPFSVAPCQTLVSRFATFSSPYRRYDQVGDSIMLTAAMKMVVWPLRWPLLHLATRVHARLRSASAATQVRGREREREREIMLTAAMKMVVWPLRWPLLHLATQA
jgi:ABC-type Fe3+-siderophore transport system permease subunit